MEDNIKGNVTEIGSKYVEWIQVAQDPVAGFCEHSNNPLGVKQRW